MMFSGQLKKGLHLRWGRTLSPFDADGGVIALSAEALGGRLSDGSAALMATDGSTRIALFFAGLWQGVMRLPLYIGTSFGIFSRNLRRYAVEIDAAHRLAKSLVVLPPLEKADLTVCSTWEKSKSPIGAECEGGPFRKLNSYIRYKTFDRERYCD
ncbi:hypothetical protein C0Q88_25865 [Ralstonia pickettii]|uniref:Uncharacterized protein n=1 Tax=Ralstonia pickettii TaxID=329 RepID=A0A2N4TJE9_RALPI|nr:hypothetical protein C0Q88_25865 [Ralstonia pickettii]